MRKRTKEQLVADAVRDFTRAGTALAVGERAVFDFNAHELHQSKVSSDLRRSIRSAEELRDFLTESASLVWRNLPMGWQLGVRGDGFVVVRPDAKVRETADVSNA